MQTDFTIAVPTILYKNGCRSTTYSDGGPGWGSYHEQREEMLNNSEAKC